MKSFLFSIFTLFLACPLPETAAAEIEAPSPELAEEFGLDPDFYRKTLMAEGILIASSERVSDHAILETAYQFERMLEPMNEQVARRIREDSMLCLIVAHDELTSEVPQFRTDLSGRELDFYNWRKRGFLTRINDRRVVFFAEEDVMEYEGGMLLESILIHEFGHVIDFAGLTEEQREQVAELHRDALERGLWNDGRAAQRFRRVEGDEPTPLLGALSAAFPDQPEALLKSALAGGDILVNGEPADVDVKVTGDDRVLIMFGGEKRTYAAKNRAEYFAEGVQCWFDTNRTMDHDHNHIHTREQLKTYDPDLARFLADVLGEGEWRFISPRERGGEAHLEEYDPDTAPEVVQEDFIREAALDYYDEYWKDYWQRLHRKYPDAMAAGSTD